VRVRILTTVFSALVALVAAGSVGAVSDARPTVSFAAAPRHVNPGDAVTVTVKVKPANLRCTLAVRYATGRRQGNLAPVRAARGRATWEWTVPDEVTAGVARLTASCGRSARVARSMSVVGTLVPAKIEVLQTGFSIRPKPRQGARLSYGVILENQSPNQDAHDLTVLVNMVDDANNAWGSKVTKLSGIRAGGRYALGSYLDFPGVPPVTRLEVVVQIGGRAPASRKPPVLWTMPELVNVSIFPDDEPEWVGGVQGEVVHNAPKWMLDRAGLSVVVFDAFGNIIGGGYGTHNISLLPSARAVFRIGSGFDAIKMTQASSVMVSVTPQYRQLGS
jgi:hypothetical protein